VRSTPIVDVKQFAVQQTGPPNRPNLDAVRDPFGATDGDRSAQHLIGQVQAIFVERKRRRDQICVVSIFQKARLSEEKTYLRCMIQDGCKSIISKYSEVSRYNGQLTGRNCPVAEELVHGSSAAIVSYPGPTSLHEASPS
jgi:hypothetical protein